MPSTVKLAEYLFTRLRQLGVGSVHGVPGDYNLTLLDYVVPSQLQWVGNANELNAGYAADGYARIKGMGALVTTFGVGELSAANAIAGSYAERAAVVHIVGTPGRPTQDSRALVHHTFNDGEYRRFARMAAHITVAQADLRDPRTSPEQIDEVLRMCLLHSRPVYIEVPADMVALPVSAERLATDIRVPTTVPNQAQDDALKQVLDKIYTAKQPVILVDGETRAMDVVHEVETLVQSTKWPTWTTPFGKSLVDETNPNVFGVYQGKFADSKVKEFVDQSDLVLCFGPHFSSTNSYGYTSIPNRDIIILFSDTEIRIGTDQVFRDVPVKSFLSQLRDHLDVSKVKHNDFQDIQDPAVTVSSRDPITQEKFWRAAGKAVSEGDIILGETGTSGYGVRAMKLPPHTRMFLPVTWLSIGYMLPATQGAALAQRELIRDSKYHGIEHARTILFVGDGSLQMTVQEIATMVRLNLDIVIFVINNDGYTIERCIHGLKAAYNDISPWRYLQAPSLFGAPDDAFTATVRTFGELDNVFKDDRFRNGRGLKMVEVFMDREDVPPGMLLSMINNVKELEKDGIKI